MLDGDEEGVGPPPDIYGLGAIPHSLLTGRPPQGDRHEPPSTDAEFASIIQRCLARIPAERYATSGAVAEELRAWLGRSPV